MCHEQIAAVLELETALDLLRGKKRVLALECLAAEGHLNEMKIEGKNNNEVTTKGKNEEYLTCGS